MLSMGTARIFGPLPTEKIIHVWRWEGRIRHIKKDYHNLCCPTSLWPDLEDNKKSGY